MTELSAFERIETFAVFDVSRDRIRQAVAPRHFGSHPYRDPDALADTWDAHGTVRGVADELDCSPDTASKWLHAYGIRELDDTQALNAYLRRPDVGPEDVGLGESGGGRA